MTDVHEISEVLVPAAQARVKSEAEMIDGILVVLTEAAAFSYPKLGALSMGPYTCFPRGEVNSTRDGRRRYDYFKDAQWRVERIFFGGGLRDFPDIVSDPRFCGDDTYVFCGDKLVWKMHCVGRLEDADLRGGGLIDFLTELTPLACINGTWTRYFPTPVCHKGYKLICDRIGGIAGFTGTERLMRNDKPVYVASFVGGRA